MNRIFLILAAFVFVGAGAYHVFTVIDGANSLLENSVDVDNLSDNPEKYRNQTVQLYGRYSALSSVDGPTNYTLVGEDTSLPISDCSSSGHLGEHVFVRGKIVKSNYTGIDYKQISENYEAAKSRDSGKPEGINWDIRSNKTAYIIECVEILG